jgi:transposase
LAFFLKDEIEREPVEISRIAKIYRLEPNTLEKQYKNHLSVFLEFKKWYKDSLEKEAFVFSKNFGTDMAIDETGLVNGDLYTFLINKDAKGKKGAIAAMIKGTKSKVIVDAIMNKVGLTQLKEIKEITMDLSNSMDWIASQIAPQGLKTYDRFHVQQLVSKAVQAERIKLRWKAIDEESDAILAAKEKNIRYYSPIYDNGDTKKQLLARGMYVLYKPSSKWSEDQAKRSVILFKEFPSLKKAYDLSMYFRNCYEQKNNHLFSKWIEKAEKSDFKEMKVAAKTVKSHLPGISNYFINKATNANIESFNAKLKLFRRNTRGISDKDFFFFRLMVYFV